jgi:hypothetical protein
MPPLPPMPPARPAAATSRPMPPRSRPLPRVSAAPTLTERLAEEGHFWLLALTVIPLITTVLGPFLPPFLQAILVLGCLPSVVLIPFGALWQMGFLLHLYLSENEIFSGRLVTFHLLSMMFMVWIWMYCMPSV